MSDEIEKLREENQMLRMILSSIAPDRVPGPFICGALGKADDTGLHSHYTISPTFGVDPNCSAVYKRVDVEGEKSIY